MLISHRSRMSSAPARIRYSSGRPTSPSLLHPGPSGSQDRGCPLHPMNGSYSPRGCHVSPAAGRTCPLLGGRLSTVRSLIHREGADLEAKMQSQRTNGVFGTHKVGGMVPVATTRYSKSLDSLTSKVDQQCAGSAWRGAPRRLHGSVPSALLQCSPTPSPTPLSKLLKWLTSIEPTGTRCWGRRHL
jgi:hypothetical protein